MDVNTTDVFNTERLTAMSTILLQVNHGNVWIPLLLLKDSHKQKHVSLMQSPYVYYICEQSVVGSQSYSSIESHLVLLL